MKARVVLCLLIVLLAAGFTSRSFAQVPASQDTIVILGDIPNATAQHPGTLESTINGDTTNTGLRINPNRVYALQEGHWYYQIAPIYVNNSTGILTIVGIPDSAGTTKPVILIQPIGTVEVGSNTVYGSIKMVNIHYQTMEMDGFQNGELFYCGTANNLPQSLTIDNCLFEFSNTDLFDCTNETGAIGGWPHGAKFFITNSYFRNLFEAGTWWGSRIFQCKHPIDTMWIENNTVTTGGLTFLQQNELTDFAYINHNTIVNNQKCWLLSPYHHFFFVTNNIFINQNWVGEDTNETNEGQDPDKSFMSTIDIDSNSSVEGEIVQPKYMLNNDTANIDQSQLGLNKLRIFVSDNDNYDDPIMNAYYTNENQAFEDTAVSFPLSYLGWFYPSPQKVENIPGEWMNTLTLALFAAYKLGGGNASAGCGFVEQNTVTGNPHTVTPGIADSATMVQMAIWNQQEYGDPRYSTITDNILNSKYIYGDYNPKTIPGIDTNGNKTENGIGIRRFTDLGENFSQTTYMSKIDGLPLGAQIWDDIENASYVEASAGFANSSEYHTILNAATMAGVVAVKGTVEQMPQTYALLQNYPNPFNPTTVITYHLPINSFVTLKIYDVLGREVVGLVNGRQNAGSHSVIFNASNLPSGLYFYRLQAGTFSETKKLLLLK